MSSVFDQQFESWAGGQLDQQFGVSAILQRAHLKTAAFTVAFNKVSHEMFEVEDDINTTAERRIWYPLIADLVFVGETATFAPRHGDILLVGSESHQIAPMGDQKAVRDHPSGLRYTISTIQVN